MCFIGGSSSDDSAKEAEAELEKNKVQRHQADASLTKTNSNTTNAFKQNIKTTPLGLLDEAPTQKNTLLGE